MLVPGTCSSDPLAISSVEGELLIEKSKLLGMAAKKGLL